MIKLRLQSALLFIGLLSPWAQTYAIEKIPLIAPATAPIVQQKHFIPKAIQVELTPKGISYFERNLMDVINNIGFSIDEAYLDKYQWTSEEEYDLEAMSTNSDSLKLIGSIRDTLRDWFLGYEAKSVKPSIKLANAGYQAVFNKFSISVNPDKLRMINKTNGAILTFEAELQKLNLGISRIRAWDQNATDLGQVGFNNFRLQVGGDETPIKIRMSFYVSINSKGVPEFEIVDTYQNFDRVNLQLKNYELVIPAIEVMINGKAYPFNKAHLEQEFASKLPEFMIQIREYLHSFVSEKVPGILNELAQKHLVNSVEEIKALDAPGGIKGGDNSYQWGLQLIELNQNENFHVSMNAYIEDEQNPNSKPDSSQFAKRPPLLNTVPKEQFDLSVGVDLAMINRLLQLSYERGFFEKIPLDTPPSRPQKCPTKPVEKGQFLKLTEAPKLTPVDYRGLPLPGWGETYVKAKLGFQVPSGTVKDRDLLAIEDNFVMNAEVILKLKKGKNAMGFDAQLWSVDPNSIQIDNRYFTWLGRLMKKKVIKTIADELKNMATGWQCNEATLADDIQIVNSIFGIETNLKHIVTEPTGYLVLYLNFVKKGNNP